MSHPLAALVTAEAIVRSERGRARGISPPERDAEIIRARAWRWRRARREAAWSRSSATS